MEIELHKIKIRDIYQGYQDHDENGVVGFSGKLNIRPAYQREFVYKDKARNAVIKTVQKGFPLNVMYWAETENGNFELLDGQQRTISICQYVKGDFSVESRGFPNLTMAEKEQILNYELMVYICKGTDRERLDWFTTINIAGMKLTDQELLNATYPGPWLSDAKKHFSKKNCVAYQIGSRYLNGEVIRQEYLEKVLQWVSAKEKIQLKDYMALHQHDTHATPLWQYFQNIIHWIETIFPQYKKEMKGLNWGNLYEQYHEKSYDPKVVTALVEKLYADAYVQDKKGVFEYILGGCVEQKLLNVRVFDESVKNAKYQEQTSKAKKQGISNCPLCAVGMNANKNRIYEIEEMDADHVSAWSKGGTTDISNCEMLCITHNRAKGNR